MGKLIVLLSFTLMLTACWNGENINVRLGDVSLGQQLMDLKQALDAQAISQDEYSATKEKILALVVGCEEPESDNVWF